MNLIKSLCNYYDLLEKKGELFLYKRKQPIEYKICLDEKGNIVNIIKLVTKKDKDTPPPIKEYTYAAEYMGRTKNVSSLLMDVNPKYMFGLYFNEKNICVTKEHFAAFKKENECLSFEKAKKEFEECSTERRTKYPVTEINELCGFLKKDKLANAICQFMDKWEVVLQSNNIEQKLQSILPEELLQQFYNVIDNGTNIVFVLDGSPNYILGNEECLNILFQKKFDDLIMQEQSRQDRTKNIIHKCAITNQKVVAPLKHLAIKRIANIDPKGTPLFSLNGTAFETYNSNFMETCNISFDSMIKYTKTLNWLLDPVNKHCRHINESISIILWYDKETDVAKDICQFSISYDMQKIEQVVDKLLQNKIPTIDNNIYIVGFSGILKTRITINFMQQFSETDICQNLKKFKDNLQISATKSINPCPQTLINAITKNTNDTDDDKTKKLLNKIMPDVIKSAYFGIPLPDYIGHLMWNKLHSMLVINHFNIAKTYNKFYTPVYMGYLKAYFTNKTKEVFPIMVDENSTNNAYIYGRIFAYITANVYNKFRSTMSPQEASERSEIVSKQYGALLLNDVAHIALVIENCNRKYDLSLADDKNISFLFSKINNNKSTLMTLQDKLQFILGYTQQKDSFYSKTNNNTKQTQ